MTVAYTIGASELYDRPDTTHKGAGGSVWRTKQAALDYFEFAGGKVILHGENTAAGVYEVYLPNGWEDDTVSEYAAGEWRPLRVKAKLGERIQ